jgi:Na+/melibiose symporter-like transporter
VAASAAGLVAVTYGLIKAGQDGWGNLGGLGLMAAGLVLLVGFFAWERRLTRQPGGQPLIDLGLFASPSFTWGVVLAVVPILAMLGILFTMPQYFQGVLGTSAMGSGLRLLPLVAGLMIGALPAARAVQVVGAKVAVAAGFALLAAGLFLGSLTSVGSSSLFVVMWMVVAGIGTGIAMTTAMSAALVELSEEKSGVGAAVLQAVNKTGGPFGIAVLGSVLSAGYLSHLDLSGLSATAAAAARQSVFGGVAVARKIHSASLLKSVEAAFVHGMDQALLVSAGIAVVGAVLTAAFLPKVNAPAKEGLKLGTDDGRGLVGPQPAAIGHAA